jgi:hypothetical protein
MHHISKAINNPDVKVGVKVRSLKDHFYCDGSFTYEDQIITVTPETLAYYQMFCDGVNFVLLGE